MDVTDSPGPTGASGGGDDYDPWLSDDRDVVVRALDLGPDPVVVLEVARDGSGCPARITYANTAFADLVGLATTDLVGKRVGSIEESGERSDVWTAFGEGIRAPGGPRIQTVIVPSAGGDVVELEAGISPLRVGGVTHHALVVLRPPGGPSAGALVSARRAPAPHHDPVTGLPDRAQLLERLHHSLRPLRTDEVAVLIISVDRLECEPGAPADIRRPSVRPARPATPGVGLPDDVAVEVAERLRAAVRGEDLVARIAPDRFAVVCEPLTDADEARRVLRRVRRYLSTPVETDRALATVSVSHGIAVSHPRDQAEGVLARAEAALAVTPIGGRADGRTG